MDLISLEKPQKKGNLPYVILDEKKEKNSGFVKGVTFQISNKKIYILIYILGNEIISDTRHLVLYKQLVYKQLVALEWHIAKHL